MVPGCVLMLRRDDELVRSSFAKVNELHLTLPFDVCSSPFALGAAETTVPDRSLRSILSMTQL